MASLTQRQLGQIIGDLKRQGVVVQKRSKNVHRLTFPDKSTIVVHSSPSDTNWHHHLRRATLRAGLHWPGEDRKTLKTVLREKAGRSSVVDFVTEYGGHVSESVSQDAQDRIAKELSGKAETRIPVLVERTGISSPTVMKALIRLGWLQKSEKTMEVAETRDGRRTGVRRAYWAPAPESTLEQVHFKGKDVSLVKSGERYLTKREKATVTVAEPAEVVDVDTPQVEPVPQITVKPDPTPSETQTPEPDRELAKIAKSNRDRGIPTPEKTEDEWFAEAVRLEREKIEIQTQRDTLKAENEKLKAAVEHKDRLLTAQANRHAAERDRLVSANFRTIADGDSWVAPGIAELPEATTITELFATLRLMGLEPEIRLNRTKENAA